MVNFNLFINVNEILFFVLNAPVVSNETQPWWVSFIIIPIVTTIIFPTIKACVEKDPKAFINYFLSLIKKEPKTPAPALYEKPCINCKEQQCRDCEKQGVECNLPEVLSFNTEKNFTVSIPAYEMPLYNEKDDLFLSGEAVAMQTLIRRLKKAGFEGKKYQDGIDDKHCHEIHIGSPIANIHTAKYMEKFEKFKYIVPADALNSRPNFDSLKEDDKKHILNTIEIAGLDVTIKGEYIKAKRIYDSDSKHGSGEFTVNGNKLTSSLSKGESIKVHGKADIKIIGSAITEKIPYTNSPIKEEVKNINKILLEDKEVITIECVTDRIWAFKYGDKPNQQFICSKTKDYAVLIKMKRTFRTVHLLFGSGKIGTKQAVATLLHLHSRIYEKIRNKEEYFIIIPIDIVDEKAGIDDIKFDELEDITNIMFKKNNPKK